MFGRQIGNTEPLKTIGNSSESGRMENSRDFFRQYNRIILATFSLVAIVSSTLFYLQCRSRYEHEVSTITTKFAERSSSLDALVKGAADHINVLQVSAQSYFADHETGHPSQRFAQLENLPQKNYFALDRIKLPYTPETIAALTGEGHLEQVSPTKKRELEMALSLSPLFRSAQKNIPNLAWVYYTSQQNFIALYPWVPSKDFLFDRSLYEQELYQSSLPKQNPDRQMFWAKAYTDAGGKGLMVTTAAPVYERNEYRGYVALDFTLDELNQFVKTFKISSNQQEFFVINQQQQLLAHPTLVSSQDQEIKSLQAALPEALQKRSAEVLEIPVNQVSYIDRYLVFRYSLKNAPWQVFLWVPQQEIVGNSLLGSNWIFLLLLPGLGLVLAIASYLTRREFIRPAQKLVEHIEMESQGISPEPSHVALAWQPWFEEVSRSFDKNRSLLQQLEAKAQALESKNVKLQITEKLLADANQTLEAEVDKRTNELKNTLQTLKNTQAQLVQTEKMSSLGQMVAGIAHEINNPVSFIHGNLDHVDRYAQSLIRLVKLGQFYGSSSREVEVEMKAIDFNFLENDFAKVIGSMRMGTERIREIVLSLRSFSRLDESGMKAVDIHAGIDSTLLILQSRLRSSNIQLIKEYGDLPLVECYAGQMNQVFMNVINNAIDALEGIKEPMILITTANHGEYISIQVKDNGLGIPEATKARLFDPFFTTKPVGKGTGLGLSISYQIITMQHRGKLWCDFIPGEGTKFVIEIPVFACSPQGVD
jgi:two-component system, NtrC family, sensor kinase